MSERFILRHGQRGRMVFSVQAGEEVSKELWGAVLADGVRVMLEREGVDTLLVPVIRPGVYLLEVRCGGCTVVYGELEVQPSPLGEVEGEVAWSVEADLTQPLRPVHVVLHDGPRGASAYEVAVMQGFVGSESEWLESIRQETATLAVEQVTPLMVRAEEAATNARNSETAAGDYAAGASRAEESAEEHAKDAAGSAAEAQAQAEAAIASAEVADEKARAAESSANEAFGYAAQAAAGAAGAQVDATNAANSASQAKASATSADSSKTQAAASATQAATSATNAAQSATAAESAATQAAESAATLADVALQGGDNTFSGTNTLTGSIKLANQKARSAGDFVFMQGAIVAWLVEGYSWTKEALKRDFGALNAFSFPDDMPFPAVYDVATVPWECGLQYIKLTKLPESWLFDKAEATSSGYHRWHFFFPNTLEKLPENMTLDNLKTAHCLFSETKISQLPAGMTLKNSTDFRGAFQLTNLTSIPEGMTFENAVDVASAFRGTKIKRLPAGMTLPKATDISSFCSSCSELEELPEGFNPPAKKAEESFLRCRKLTRLPDSFTLSECTHAGACFRETIFTTLPEGMTLEKLQDAGTSYHEGMFQNSQIRTLPAALNLKSLSNGKKMFYGCQLDRDSALRVLTTIPAYTSGSHPLTVGIHVDHQADEEVLAAIDAATASGWTVTTQWNGTATRTTFALRPTPAPPVYAKREQSEYGGSVDATNTRYSVDWGHMVTSPDGREPEALGYTLFDTLESALEAWGLVEYEEGGER